MFFRKNSKTFNLSDTLAGCLKGRQSDQRKLYEQYYSLGKSICLRYAANQEQAEEMVNDGFLRILENLHQYDFTRPFEAWFRTVVVRTSIDYYRKHQSKGTHLELEETLELEWDDDLLENISANEILSLVQQLPPAYRAVFSLFVVDGFNHAEIAEMLGINEGTSRSNLAKARAKMNNGLKCITLNTEKAMSSKRFDHQIKNKLESVQPPYIPAAWQNFQQLLPVPWHMVIFQKYAGRIYSGAATIALITLFFFYGQEREHNLHLQKEIARMRQDSFRRDSLQTNLDIAQLPLPVTNGSAQDTLYIIKKVFLQKENAPNLTHGNLFGVSNLRRDDKESAHSAQNQIGRYTISTTFAREHERLNTERIASTANNELLIDTSLVLASALPLQDSNQSQRGDSLSNNNQRDTTQIKKVTFPATRLGVSGGVNSNNEVTYGPSLEYFVGKKISIETGIQFSRGLTGNFDSLYRFTRVKPGTDSTSLIRYDSLVSFKQSTKIFRLPIQFNYYHTFNNNLSMFITAGTHLHLAVAQKMSLHQRSTEAVLDQFERTVSPIIFNNVFIGAGVEYKFRSLSLQITPYYRYTFKTPSYEPRPARTGVNVNMKINLTH
ncbi:sigma-70 family RNA polymerase sigma factor [Rufibacter sp. DG15C]|uniref:sigma-70 family RNA polymerase sigma factor n=1 Tax=Rufibacter sp. DG15C TaxID=1379909 RepID=UPI00090051C8|nr:sigma-70 family RNA polymerase sigma factor [Rufibacter sp. DG15C]